MVCGLKVDQSIDSPIVLFVVCAIKQGSDATERVVKPSFTLANLSGDGRLLQVSEQNLTLHPGTCRAYVFNI